MDRSISGLRGIGPARQKALAQAGIFTVRKLIMCLPKEYRDLTRPTPLKDARAGDTCAVRVYVAGAPSEHNKGRLSILRTIISDDTGSVPVVWFNQPWLKQQIVIGRELLLYGRFEAKNGQLQLNSPSIEREAALTPIYARLNGIQPRAFQALIHAALRAQPGEWPDEMPKSILERFGLCDYDFAIRNAHMPKNHDSLIMARRRLSFDELLYYQMAISQLRAQHTQGVRVPVTEDDARKFLSALPFEPTGAQARALIEIARDLAAPHAMARMLQGDVGCGKTAVAFGAMALCAQAGYQSALMAPTEVLAAQHYQSALKTLAPLGYECGLLTGSMTLKAHKIAHEKISSGEWRVVFGTHALITEEVTYNKLGLVITDEQHRFGVRQRALLSEKGDNANVLVMSATPIPRTLSLVLFGDLDLSIIDEMPPGRLPVKTRVVPETKRADMYMFIKRQVALGYQAYVVCPLVDESEAVDAQSAEMLFENLKTEALTGVRVGMAHGRMKPSEKDGVIDAFRKGEIDVLVSTTVIEVGVDVPNANVMVIENAERFGLAQLHQLRGRVGRGAQEAWCFLMAQPNERLQTLTRVSDGFKIAEKDMELRGAGELFGTRQSGAMTLGLCAPDADAELIKLTHDLARELIKRPIEDVERARVLECAKKSFEGRIGAVSVN